MKLETSQDLLLRLRAAHNWSWYRLAKELHAHENTVYGWKRGATVVDRKFAPRLAELLGESAEYVLACLEADREENADLQKVWERIGSKFRGHAASILLVSALVLGVGNATKAEASKHSPAGAGSPPMYVMTNRRRAKYRCPRPRPWWDFATWFPVPA